MDTKQSKHEQIQAMQQRRKLYDLHYKITAKRQRFGLTGREAEVLAAVDAELERLRVVGSARLRPPKKRRRGKPLVASGSFHRPGRRDEVAVAVVSGGLPGTGR